MSEGVEHSEEVRSEVASREGEPLGVDAPKETPEAAYPTTEDIEAAAQTGRDLIDHPEVVGVDKESEAYETWESEDGEHSRKTLDKVGEQASVRVVCSLDVDETRLVRAPVETVNVLVQIGQQRRAVAGGQIIVSGGKLVLAVYTDFLDRNRDLSNTKEAFEMAQMVIDQAVEQLKSEHGAAAS